MIFSTRYPNRQTKSNDGYVTVFFTASIAIIMSLILGLFVSIRENAIRVKTVSATDTAMTSIFSEYNKELWKQYGLIFVDSSYMTQSYGMKLSEEHLKDCMNKNFDECRLGLIGGTDLLKLECSQAETLAVCLSTDDQAAAIEHQAINLMKYHYKVAYIDRVVEWIKIIEDYNLSEGVSYDEAFSSAGILDSKYGLDYSGWLPSDSGGNSLSEDIVWPWNILKRVAGIENISTIKIDTQAYAGKRELNKGNLKCEYDKNASDFFFLREYALLKCGNFITPKEGSVLKYQSEYLVSGKDSDCDNLASVARRIMVIREAANMITLLSDGDRMNKISIFCTGICAALGIPEATELLETIIIAYWVNCESKTDLKIIMNGGKIPLIKDCSQWITGIGSILFGSDSSGNYTEGLSYEDYLRIFIYLTGEKKLVLRLSDIIEMDIRNTPGNEYFRLDNCFDMWEAQVYVKSDHGLDFTAVRKRQVLE